ncbi:YciI family protein [Rathayibacter soli]|uniref:YciI family protein n=1 Tax=Rathayibacter soli TaxID=3144168 RepID=UPI0027E3B926|nr:YciI family protein [Glaciibacter superstes]
MQYALLAYGRQSSQETAHPIEDAIAAVLTRPEVTGWARLHADESATTVRHGTAGALLTDGPFIETKEFLAGVIFVDADDLDGALAIARALQEARTSGAIEVRPVRETLFRGT